MAKLSWKIEGALHKGNGNSCSETNAGINGDSTSSQTEQVGCAADQHCIFWKSPFAYSKLSFMAPESPLIYKDGNIQAHLAEFQQRGSQHDLKIHGLETTSAVLCHSSVLCAVSSVIKSQPDLECHRPACTCPHACHDFYIPHETLVLLVDYAYTGHIELNAANILSITCAADSLGMDSLMTAASTFLSASSEKFDLVSCYKALSVLEKHDRLQPLIPMYKRRVMEHIAEIFKSDECFMDMSFEFVIGFLETESVNFGSETKVVGTHNRMVSVDPSCAKTPEDGISDTISNRTEQIDSAADRGTVLWESPFQYAKLSFLAPEELMELTDRSLRTRVLELVRSDSLRDLKIRGSGSTSTISCHSSVLCALSSVIKTRLGSKLHHGELNFENIPHETVLQLVYYAYTGHIWLDEANVLSVYSAADFLDIEYLLTSALRFLSNCTESFDGVSCYKVFRFLEQHDKLQLLIPMYERRMTERIAEVFNSDDCLMDMSFEFVIGFLEDDSVNFGPEMEIIQALDRWVSMDPSREAYLTDLASRIRWDDVEQDPPSEDVNDFKCKLKSAVEDICDMPKIGSRNRGLTGGFLIHDGVGSPLLLDIKSQKIKVLPKYPVSVYLSNPYKFGSNVSVADSDDGDFYVVSKHDQRTSPDCFDLLRLNVVQDGWDIVMKYRTSDSGQWSAYEYSVLGGNLCLFPLYKDDCHVKCLNLTTSEVKCRIAVDRACIWSGVSAELSSIFFLYEYGKVIRFDARSCKLSDVKIDIPSEQLRGCTYMMVNAAGQATLYDGKTQFWVCLESGRVMHSKAMGAPQYDWFLVQDSLLKTSAEYICDDYPTGQTHQKLYISRDRGALGGWNPLKTYSLILPVRSSKSCNFARALINGLPDHCES